MKTIVTLLLGAIKDDTSKTHLDRQRLPKMQRLQKVRDSLFTIPRKQDMARGLQNPSVHARSRG